MRQMDNILLEEVDVESLYDENSTENYIDIMADNTPNESWKRIPVPPKLKRLKIFNKITIKALVEKENDITETMEHDVESADVVELFLADPPLVVSSRFTHVRASVCACVRACVRVQLTKLFNIFGSGWDISLKSFGDIPRMFLH